MSGENINRRLNIYINDREVTNSMRGINSEMAKVRNQMNSLNRGAADYDQQLARLKSTYTQLQQQQARFRSDMGQTQGILQRAKASLGGVATGMLAAFSIQSLVGKFTAGISQAYKIIVDFDQKQADLAAIMQKSRMQISGLTADAIKYGASTSYSAAEVSVLQTELARLGKTAPEIRAMTKDVLNAATALETDLGSAAALIGGQLNSYGESADKAAKYSDIMANSVNISATSYEYLEAALPKVSAVAANSNVTFEKLNATMGVLADQNIQAETAGTGFRNILLESAKAGKPYQEMLDEVKNSANQGKKAVELFGKENATVAVIMANSTDKIIAQTEALESSAGSAAKLAEEKMNSISGAAKNFSSAWEGFLLNIEKGDGVIGKSIKGVIEFGSSFLNLISPMKRVSDQLQEEQLGLNMLVSKITSSNIKNEERKQLLIQLKNEYPEFNKLVDVETASNEELNTALGKVNDQYVKRIALQQQAEKVEDASKDQGSLMADQLKWQDKLFKKLNELKGKYSLKVPIDYGNLTESAKKVKAELAKIGEGGGLFGGDNKTIDAYVNQVETFKRAAAIKRKEVEAETDVLNRQSESLGINTEAENDSIRAKEAAALAVKKLREEAQTLGMKEAMTAPEEEVRRWIMAYKEKMKYSGEMSEEEAKKREKELADRKKHTEDLKKQLLDSESDLLETKRSFQDLNNVNLKESFANERDILNTEYDRKIEDLKIKIAEEQREIDKLSSEKKNPKNTKQDIDLLQKQINNKIALQRVYNDTVVSMEKSRDLKLGALQEKYIQKDFQEQDEANARELQNLQTKHNFELSAITSLQEAKAFLSNTLSSEELKKVTTIEGAKKKIKEQFQKEEFALQQKHLIDMMAAVQAVFAQEQLTGIELISPEQREALMKFLDEAANKLSIIKAGGTVDDEEKEGTKLTGIDILGFTPEQWEKTFESLDEFSEKIAAVETVAAAMKNAFGMFFDFFDARDQRSLQKFQKNTDRKKKALADQLERGYITQEVYNARVEKLDQEMAKKQAEMEYKKAKREKIMAALQIVAQTAIGVAKAMAESPMTFGLPWSAVIAALGAVQLASVLAAPLPPKGGYKDGGYTGDGPADEYAGPAHKGEYVIPKHVLFGNDPVMPNIISYVEAKRKGKTPAVMDSPAGSSANSPAGSYETDSRVIDSLDRNSAILEKIEKEGVPAFLENNLKTAKKIRNRIKDLEKLESESKI